MLFFINYSYAQNVNDTLREVQIHGKHSPKISNSEKLNIFSPGQKIISIDSLTLSQYQMQNVANLLSQQVPVFVRSYGFNNLATLNFRGSSAAQSEVLWNGVPINNASLGIADVSELPVFLMNKINIVYGSSSALWGSGNVGGALLIENDIPAFGSNVTKTLSLMAGLGSFGQYTGGAKFAYSNKRWSFAAKGFLQTALNNFPYTNAGVETKMPNSKLFGAGLLMQGAYQISKQNVLGISVWYQQYNRQIPPALFEDTSRKDQIDGSLRLLLNWDKKADKNTWYAKASLIRDYMHYEDLAIPLSSTYVTYQYYQEAGWNYKFNSHSELLLFTPVQISWMHIQSLNETRQQTKVALAGAYNIRLLQSRLNIAINAREEMVNSTNMFLPGMDASYSLTNWLSVRGNAQYTYRVPTLNELYYYPGGNADLKPEKGWNEDAGYTIKLHISNNITLSHDLSVFNRDIHDWIIWFGGAVWTPHNIAVVNSKGLETENTLQWQLNKWGLHLGVNTSYVLATTQSSYIPNDGSIGKQIPYTPRYNGQLNIGFLYKGLYFNYNHDYVGYRYVTTDESEYLLPYQIGNIQAAYSFSLNHYILQVSAQCNNIWNRQYQIVGYRPMPGINYMLGVKFNLM